MNKVSHLPPPSYNYEKNFNRNTITNEHIYDFKMHHMIKLLIFLIYLPDISPTPSDLFPVSTIGTKKLMSPHELSCDVLRTKSMHDIITYKVKLPFQESNTRLGYFCSQTNVTIDCQSGWFSYHFDTKIDKISVSDEACRNAVLKFKGGHIGGSIISTPECAYWSHSAKKGDQFLIVSSAVLPFSPELNGVRSKVFVNSVCQDSHCITLDKKTHWFLGDDEKSGCDQLQDGFLEVSSLIRASGNARLVTTNLFKNILWDSLCVGPMHCGHLSIIGPDHKTILPDPSEIDLYNLISTYLPLCPPDVKVREISRQNFISISDYSSSITLALHVCTIKLTEMKQDSELKENQLAIFEPLEEGIYPGYRIEGNQLYQYDLLYLMGTFSGHPIGSSKNQFLWEITDVTGYTHQLSQSLCLFEDDESASITGGTCKWFNGIKMRGSNLYKPTYLNYFGTSGYITSIYLGPHTGLKNATENSPGIQFNLGNPIWLITLMCGATIIAACFLIYLFRKKGHKDSETPYMVEWASTDKTSPRRPNRNQRVENRSIPLQERPRLMILRTSSQLQQPRPAIKGLEKPMLQWFER